MPIYKVSEKEVQGLGAALGNVSVRLIKADSAAQAIRHCTAGRFTAETVTKVEEAADLMASGVKVETAGEAPAEPKVEPEGDEADPVDPPASDTPPNDDPPEEVRKQKAREKGGEPAE